MHAHYYCKERHLHRMCHSHRLCMLFSIRQNTNSIPVLVISVAKGNCMLSLADLIVSVYTATNTE